MASSLLKIGTRLVNCRWSDDFVPKSVVVVGLEHAHKKKSEPDSARISIGILGVFNGDNNKDYQTRVLL